MNYETLIIDHLIGTPKEKNLIDAQKNESIRFVSWLCNTGKIQEILDNKKTEAELYEEWTSRT